MAKHLSRHACFFLCLVVVAATGGTTLAAASDAPDGPPVINVVYPADSQAIGPVDSTSIRGSVTPGAKLTINGQSVDVYRTGGFIAFLPVAPGWFVFRLEAENESGYSVDSVGVFIAGAAPIPPDSGAIIRAESIRPLWNRTIRPGDEISVGFQGTVGGRARFWVVSAVDSLGPYAMTELPRQALGTFSSYRDNLRRLADSLPLLPARGTGQGRYHGIWRVPSGLDADTLWAVVELIAGVDSVDTAVAQAKGGLRPIESLPPRVVELTDSVQTLRMGPRLGYLTIFQPYGVRARWWGEAGPWTIIQPAPGYEAWIETEKTRLLPEGTPLPGTLIDRLQTVSGPTSVRLEVGTSERLPFKVSVADDLLNVHIVVFGATSNTDWIALDPDDDLITDVAWSQTRPLVYEIDLHLSQPVWGYDARYENGRLVVEFRRPPSARRGVSDMTVVVDAGHSADRGAIGPTGLEEKNANLTIAHALKHYLERRGARVVMTRWANEDVPLYDRPGKAVAEGADLFVSIHNNSVADGINPFVQNGTGTYFYHPFSRDLARQVQYWTLDATALGDYGVTHGNFAVIRPTQYPSILVECAFIIIPQQEEMLRRDEFARRVGRGIVQGIERFLRERSGR
jgi:N-acetylmuramoyl-L-alanine amidase